MTPYRINLMLADKFGDADPEVTDWVIDRASGMYGEFKATASSWEKPTKARIGMWKSRIKRDFVASPLGQRRRKELHGIVGVWSWIQLLMLVVRLAVAIWDLQMSEETT